MSLTKTTSIDQITVTENGIVLYREATRIMEDGKQLSQSFHRSSIAPGDDYSNQSDRVKAICQAAHTPAVITAYQNSMNFLG
jgi:hypothetical protein